MNLCKVASRFWVWLGDFYTVTEKKKTNKKQNNPPPPQNKTTTKNPTKNEKKKEKQEKKQNQIKPNKPQIQITEANCSCKFFAVLLSFCFDFV